MPNTINVKDAIGATVAVATNDAVKTSVDAVKTSTDAVVTSTDAVKASTDTVAAKIDTLDGSVDAVTVAIGVLDGSVDAVKASVDVVQATLLASSVTQLGTRTVAQSPAVNIATDQGAIPVAVQPAAADVKTPFTRQNNVTPYTAGQIVGALAATITFANFGKAGGASLMLTSAELEIDIGTAPATAFRLHLYSSIPGSAPADAANFDGLADAATWLGWIDFPAPVDVGNVVMSQATNLGKQIRATGADIYGVLQAVSGYTPVALAVYKITLHRAEV